MTLQESVVSDDQTSAILQEYGYERLRQENRSLKENQMLLETQNALINAEERHGVAGAALALREKLRAVTEHCDHTVRKAHAEVAAVNAEMRRKDKAHAAGEYNCTRSPHHSAIL